MANDVLPDESPSNERMYIPGDFMEGGGQILRNAMAFATLLRRPIRIDKIRGGRKVPGLKPQHATGLQLVQQISSDSVLKGAEKNSREIEFTPGHIKLGESYKADPGTAGSTTLLLQISFPCLLFSSVPTESPTCLTLGGGTNATQAPQIDYTENIFFPFIQRHFNIQATLEVRKRGYFPRGGGEVLVSVIPLTSSLPAVTLTSRGAVTRIRGKSYTAGTLPPRLAKMMAFEAARILVEAGYDSSLIDIQEVTESPEKVVGSGSGIVLWAETEGGCVIGGSATGAKGTDTRITAKQAAGELLRNLEHGGCVDEYLQDQIIIFLALTEGDSTIECGPLTLHTKTAIWIAEKVAGAKFDVSEPEGDRKTYLIRCKGIGFNKSTG